MRFRSLAPAGICTRCEIGIPSLAAPCGGCRRTVEFVPLTVLEFDTFLSHQRRKERQEREDGTAARDRTQQEGRGDGEKHGGTEAVAVPSLDGTSSNAQV